MAPDSDPAFDAVRLRARRWTEDPEFTRGVSGGRWPWPLLALEGTLMAGAGSSKRWVGWPDSLMGAGPWSGGVGIKLPYCMSDSWPSISPCRSPATGEGLLMGIDRGGLRPMGAEPVRKGSTPSSAVSGLAEAAVLNEADPERGWSPPLAGSLVDETPLARLMARATALMCFLPAL